MKKYIIIILALFYSIVTQSKTAKEYLNAYNASGHPYSYYDLYDYIDELYASKYGINWQTSAHEKLGTKFEQDLQREKDKINSYVFEELPLKMDTNSLEYADVLLRWEQFFIWSNEPVEKFRTVANRIKKIVLPLEGKRERYIKAMQFEEWSWRLSETATSSNDTIAIKQALLREMIDCCHQVYRPTDSLYIDKLKQLFDLIYQPVPVEESDDEDQVFYYIWHNEINFAVFLWQDLSRWEDITKDEYLKFCQGEVIEIINPSLSCYCNDKERILYLTFYADDFMRELYTSGRAGRDYSLYDMCRADREIVKRIAGVNSKWYCEAVERYMRASIIEFETIISDSLQVNPAGLTPSQLLETTHECFVEAKKAGALTADYARYYEMMFANIQCLMSLSGYNIELEDELKEVLVQAEITGRTEEAIRAHQLWAEAELLKGDYKNAVKQQIEVVEICNSLPQDKQSRIKDALKIEEKVIRTAVITENGNFWKTMKSFCNRIEIVKEVNELDNSAESSCYVLRLLGLYNVESYYPYQQKIDVLFEKALKKVKKSVF